MRDKRTKFTHEHAFACANTLSDIETGTRTHTQNHAHMHSHTVRVLSGRAPGREIEPVIITLSCIHAMSPLWWTLWLLRARFLAGGWVTSWHAFSHANWFFCLHANESQLRKLSHVQTSHYLAREWLTSSYTNEFLTRELVTSLHVPRTRMSNFLASEWYTSSHVNESLAHALSRTLSRYYEDSFFTPAMRIQSSNARLLQRICHSSPSLSVHVFFFIRLRFFRAAWIVLDFRAVLRLKWS